MVDGVYEITVVAMGQERGGTITVKTDGTKMTGVLDALGHTFEINDGTADENSFSFAFRANGQKLSLTAKVDAEGGLEGDGKFGFIPMVVLGKKVQ